MPGRREFVAADRRADGVERAGDRRMLPALPAIGEALDVADDNRPPAGDHLLHARLRRRAALLRAARRPVRAQAAADRLHARSMLCSRALAGLAASFDLLLAARFTAGRRGGGDAGAGRGDRARPLPGRGDGADHVAGDDRLHDRAGARAEPSASRCSRSASWREIFIVLAVYGLTLAALGRAAAARDAGTRRTGGRCRAGAYRPARAADADQPRLDRQHARLDPDLRRRCSASSARSSRSCSTCSAGPI